MARAVGDFSSQNPTENEAFSFDFTSQLGAGDSVASLVGWTATTLVGTDAGAQGKLGANSLVGNIATTNFGPAIADVEYCLACTVLTTQNHPITLWSTLKGRAIGECGSC